MVIIGGGDMAESMAAYAQQFLPSVANIFDEAYLKSKAEGDHETAEKWASLSSRLRLLADIVSRLEDEVLELRGEVSASYRAINEMAQFIEERWPLDAMPERIRLMVEKSKEIRETAKELPS
jgi:hypothetical protein